MIYIIYKDNDDMDYAYDNYEIKDNCLYIYHMNQIKIVPLCNVFEINIEQE